MSEENYSIEKGPFKPDWQSLRNFECPEWFKNAKFGIWSHWGPQAVPMYGDWYARHMYIEGHDQYRYHWRKYGHPSKFGYKDIVKLWKAENFKPEKLMELFVEAGAQYFIAQAVHHDNFDNWDSKYNEWNALNIGPKKDIVSLWQKAAEKYDLPFGVTEHLGATYKWFATNKDSDQKGPYAGVPYDGNDPEYEDFYLSNQGEELEGWYTDNEWWHQLWFKRIKDLIDKHQPDLLYSDGGVPFYFSDKDERGVEVKCASPGLNIIAHLYNTSAQIHGKNKAVYAQKDTDPEVYQVGVLDIERGMQSEIAARYWQTDTSVGDWFYNVRDEYKTPKQVLAMLVDIVSKNGNLLLNVPQLPDGSLDEECTYLLEEIADWMEINKKGIFASRPWEKAGEGPTSREGGAFNEDALEWTSEDFRFTQKDNKLFAFQMEWPENGKAVIKNLSKNNNKQVRNVSLLGYEGKTDFAQTNKGLEINLPAEKVCNYIHCFCIEF